ncbi:MAG: TonB-dependent Fe(3+) dicitrate receptor FecA [Lautropia sp.]|nr:TonB-dependent Fe(3+) dicitrate receptor FecA [Lautropia sp.]
MLLLAVGGGAAQALAQEIQASDGLPVTAGSAPAAAGDAATTEQTLGAVKVVGDWLGEAEEEKVLEHPGARDVIRRDQAKAAGATTTREVLNRIPGVNAPENNGTGSHDMAMNFGIRGLNPRLATRSTLLMDGIPVPFAPYGQPQLSLGPVSQGNMEAVDVVRGGGAVRYGPQNVGGIVNFVTRSIPSDVGLGADLQLDYSPSSTQSTPKKNASFLVGGTLENGLGGALLYSGVRGSDYREHSRTTIDDVILKGRYQLDAVHSFHAIAQYYDGEADMPGGLSVADFRADPYQSTRPVDRFWGRRTLVGAGYDYAQDDRKIDLDAFFTTTLRSGFLDQGSFVSLSPREYWVRGVEGRVAEGFRVGRSRHEVGIGYRYVNESSHELRYREPKAAGRLPTVSSRNDRDTRGQTEAHAIYLDDRIDWGLWTITPGIRYERIDQQQLNLLTGTPYQGKYSTALPALNVLYRLDEGWNLYANTEGSFGSVQYSQMPNRVKVNEIKPEKARTWELGTRYEAGVLKAELGVFLINFNNQYDSSQTTDSVIARGQTRHQGLETAFAYRLDEVLPALKGTEVYANYAYVDAFIREEGPNKGNQVPFSSRHKGLLGVAYSQDAWQVGLEGQFQSSQYADNANTVAESADGSTGRIPGYGVWNLRGSYQFGPSLMNLKLGAGIRNLFGREYFTRSFDDNNKGIYLGQPRTVFIQGSFQF